MLPDPIINTAALLVGGESRRMGSDKARALLNGTPLYMHVLRTIAPLFNDIIIVGSSADDLVSESGMTNVRSAPDIFPDRSSANGVYSALVVARIPWCCVLSCDAPFPCVPLLQLMQSHCIEPTQIVATKNSEGRFNPFHAFWHTSTAPLLESSINRGELRLQKIMSEMNVSIIEPRDWFPLDPNGRFAVNINTPDDLKDVTLS